MDVTLREAQPFHEPWRTTLRRTGGIALAIGVGVGLSTGRAVTIPVVTLFALWFSLGGHFVDLVIRNKLRNRITGAPAVQRVARLALWFIGGSLLYACALATRAITAGRHFHSWPWWIGGVGFVLLEMGVHFLMRMRGIPSFYDGRG